MAKSNALEDRSAAPPALDAAPLDAIGRALKAHYDDLLQAPLPARFEELLSGLDAAGEARGKARGRRASLGRCFCPAIGCAARLTMKAMRMALFPRSTLSPEWNRKRRRAFLCSAPDRAGGLWRSRARETLLHEKWWSAFGVDRLVEPVKRL